MALLSVAVNESRFKCCLDLGGRGNRNSTPSEARLLHQEQEKWEMDGLGKKRNESCYESRYKWKHEVKTIRCSTNVIIFLLGSGDVIFEIMLTGNWN